MVSFLCEYTTSCSHTLLNYVFQKGGSHTWLMLDSTQLFYNLHLTTVARIYEKWPNYSCRTYIPKSILVLASGKPPISLGSNFLSMNVGKSPVDSKIRNCNKKRNKNNYIVAFLSYPTWIFIPRSFVQVQFIICWYNKSDTWSKPFRVLFRNLNSYQYMTWPYSPCRRRLLRHCLDCIFNVWLRFYTFTT